MSRPTHWSHQSSGPVFRGPPTGAAPHSPRSGRIGRQRAQARHDGGVSLDSALNMFIGNNH